MEHKPGSILTEERKLWLRSSLAAVNGEHRVCETPEPKYRFIWELAYRDGTIRRQYERIGDSLIQTLFGKIPHEGIAEIRIFDARKPQLERFAVVGLPEGAIADVLYNCGFSFSEMRVERIYTFGWFLPGGACRYFHLHPGYDPPKAWLNEKRVL